MEGHGLPFGYNTGSVSQQAHVQPRQSPADFTHEHVTTSFAELGVSQNISPSGRITPSHPGLVVQPVTLLQPVSPGQQHVEMNHAGVPTFVGQTVVDVSGQQSFVQTQAGMMPPQLGVVQAQTGLVQNHAGLVQSQTGLVQNQTGYVQPQTGVIQNQSGLVQHHTGYFQPQMGLVQQPTGLIQPQGYCSNTPVGCTMVQPTGGFLQPQPGLMQPQTGVIQQSGVMQPMVTLQVQPAVCGDQGMQALHMGGSQQLAQYASVPDSTDQMLPVQATQAAPSHLSSVNSCQMTSAGIAPQFYPGWIQQMHQQLIEVHSNSQQQQKQAAQRGIGCRSANVPQMSHVQAKAPEARFRTLYPAGFHLFSCTEVPPGAPSGGNTPIRSSAGVTSVYVPVASHGMRQYSALQSPNGSLGGNGMSGHNEMEVDPTHGQLQPPVLHQPMDLEVSIVPQGIFSILDAHLLLKGGKKSVREVLMDFVHTTYCGLLTDTYRVPRKPPVSQKHPDKALVRAREGESRVSLALEYLSAIGGEAMLIISDYHYENFLKNMSSAIVVPEEQGRVTEMLNSFATGKLFGDFDLLVFHPQCRLLVIGICAVNSNSDVQYIFKRLQKARTQLEKSRSVAERAMNFLHLDCQVISILATPNLKRAFLNKVAARDKTLHRVMASLNPLCLDELPLQFRSEWMSQEHFDLLKMWWEKVKADTKFRGQTNAEQFSLLVGSFLCTDLSYVDFEQGCPAQPSERKSPSFENLKSQETAANKQTTSNAQIDLSSLALSIGNVTKSFTQYMEEYVDAYFPDFWKSTYRVPPVHFNIQKTEPVGDSRFPVLDMPMSKDTRGDEGENRVVSAIEILGMKHPAVKPVFIICDFQYNNYLNKLKETMFVKGDDRRPQRAYGQSVRAQHDCLLVQRNYGIIIVSVKAVGDNFDEWANSGKEQWTAVKRTLGKVLKQLPREEKMVQLVLSDMTSDLKFHRLIALPNLLRSDINTAISDDPELQKQIEDMFPGKGTSAFLCKDELCEKTESIWEVLESRPETFDKLRQWWDSTMGEGEEGVLSETLMKQIIGRYCGLLSTVEVWSIQTPRVEVRNLSEAVHETGERFSQILLTKQQLAVLHKSSRHVFLTGPPGGGKTTTLVLKAEQWARSQRTVVILNLRHGSLGLPLGHLLEKQLGAIINESTDRRQKSGSSENLLSVASPSNSPTSPKRSSSSPSPTTVTSILRVDCDSSRFNPANPGRLVEIPRGACVVVDEITRSSHSVLEWVVINRSPEFLWCAGQFPDYRPEGFEQCLLDQVLRCPPMVQRVVRYTSKDLGTSAQYTSDRQQYSEKYFLISAPNGLATDGSRPWLIFHSEHNSPSRIPLDCSVCGYELADVLTHRLNLQPVASTEQSKRRKLGPPPVSAETLSWKDVVIVSRNVSDCPLMKSLRKRGIPLCIVPNTTDPQVAVPSRDELIFTTPFAMTGLERKVVVYIPFEDVDPLTSDLEVDGEADEVKGRVGGEGRKVGPMDDLRLGHALTQLSNEDRVSLWYTASRCLAQLIIFIP